MLSFHRVLRLKECADLWRDMYKWHSVSNRVIVALDWDIQELSKQWKRIKKGSLEFLCSKTSSQDFLLDANTMWQQMNKFLNDLHNLCILPPPSWRYHTAIWILDHNVDYQFNIDEAKIKWYTRACKEASCITVMHVSIVCNPIHCYT